LALVLFTSHKERRRANRFLACLVLVFSLDMVVFYLDTVPSTPHALYFELLVWPRDFLYGVFFYFYVRELVSSHHYRLSGVQYLHFLPLLLHILLSWSIFLFGLNYSIEDASYFSSSFNTTFKWFQFVDWFQGDPESFIMVIHIAVYLFLVYRLLIQHRQCIKQHFSAIEKINLDWLILLTIGLSLLYFFWLISVFVNTELADQAESLVGCSLVLLIYIMGYCGLRQPLIFSRVDFTSIDNDSADDLLAVEASLGDVSEPVETKYKNSALSDDIIESLFFELEEKIKKEKFFLDNALSLARLAEKTNISTHYLSQVINAKTGGHFYDYINNYRIGFAQSLFQQLLKEGDLSTSVLDVALKSGFNSKSTFYAAFNKLVSMTPNQYKKTLLQIDSAKVNSAKANGDTSFP